MLLLFLFHFIFLFDCAIQKQRSFNLKFSFFLSLSLSVTFFLFDSLTATVFICMCLKLLQSTLSVLILLISNKHLNHVLFSNLFIYSLHTQASFFLVLFYIALNGLPPTHVRGLVFIELCVETFHCLFFSPFSFRFSVFIF